MTTEYFEQIAAEVNDLMKINFEDLDAEALRGTDIFIKLNIVYNREAAKLKVLASKLAKTELLRWRFYTGKADPKEYANNRFVESITKTDVDKYLKADEILTEAKDEFESQDRVVKMVEDSIKASRNRQFDIKNAIEWRKFQSGV
jgi:hypothetical protein